MPKIRVNIEIIIVDSNGVTFRIENHHSNVPFYTVKASEAPCWVEDGFIIPSRAILGASGLDLESIEWGTEVEEPLFGEMNGQRTITTKHFHFGKP